MAEVIRNIRIKENDFTMRRACDYCAHYVSMVVQIPRTPLYVCKTCLSHWIEEIDTCYQKNFESDFNKREYVKNIEI